MNRNDIIRMAREAGLTINDQPMLGVDHFARLVAAAEREACARVVEEHAQTIHGYDKHEYAAAIRKRGK